MKIINLFIMMVFLMPFASSSIIEITATQPNYENTLEYIIEIYNEKGEKISSEVNIYYKHENNIISYEKTKIYGKIIKTLEIDALGEYEILVIDQNRNAFKKITEVTEIRLPKENLDEEIEEERLIDKTYLLITLGVIIFAFIIFLFKLSKNIKFKH